MSKNDYKIKDINLAESGKNKIEWAEDHMPVLMEIKKEFEKTKPLKNLTVGFALHVTKETAVLVKTLIAGGAKVAIAGCNPLSTHDDVAAALASDGVNVYAWRGLSTKDYYECIGRVLDHKPDITVDDGCDLVTVVHKERPELIRKIKGGCEETTTGIIRLNAMEKDNALKYPMLAVNNAMTKHFFDNRYGTGQSTIDGILRATSVLFAGKNVVVCGYGWCGRGVAARAKGMGANIIVTEVDSIKALEAAMDGYRVMKMDEAAKTGDIFITITGDVDVIRKEHIENMKDGAILANSGHFNCEINVPELESLSKNRKEIRDNTVRYILKNNKKIYLLAEGRLVNLAAAEGHPSEVMDMSFANQALAVLYIAKHKLDVKVHDIPAEIDKKVADLKLKTMGIEIDELTKEQRKYLNSWEEGT
ncbi:MAG: adenosylhomocysteinase [Candidatus Altiarchaeum hamiconexum]|uniref:Adenosylhomocysteinase n=1 Tax=Candidatus Altarchaeum hamiconexum TaxID=1803513 RepID=A0A8J7Z3U5_9ARCH|nr:adenosylhomocysteinase [Candidatus Altarchaeum hamiconexum]PIN67713.1 MAG: adenosylhomocysteinase [Candidatus Altarchaeum sp. CG12_big_fil_rev_8_21_14_0_65_33_22]PIV28761.1 MAG: adenosylhomocysteinase [Candidatus Altarchaeum sp. CG03_land_8_20_14_0_80_32_618]PIX48221.1 MAG: adenosylhomocysteinase [Candidatus Altarchaeum sp. CG_4_8_14_3_um_filter_33_2054]PIZ29250.1 MAG: adenosylhomocysteinase [Candidatus Altarchaeum sp. CG_4_10_14_0_8_um_filter_32_851]PJC13038.1 MAG: adenosylhomocysteinase [